MNINNLQLKGLHVLALHLMNAFVYNPKAAKRRLLAAFSLTGVVGGQLVKNLGIAFDWYGQLYAFYHVYLVAVAVGHIVHVYDVAAVDAQKIAGQSLGQIADDLFDFEGALDAHHAAFAVHGLDIDHVV